MRIQKFLSCAFLFLLASCGPPQPEYRTDIELVAPRTENGRYCANNCLSSQQICYQSCTMQQQNCKQMNALQEQNSRLQAKIEYDDYVRERTEKGQKIKRSPSSFNNYNNSDCETSGCKAQCDGSFNICYGNCGGKVIPHTRCVANCNLKQAN